MRTILLSYFRGMQPRVEKRSCKSFESKNFGACNAFLHTKLTDQLETRHPKNPPSTPGLNASIPLESPSLI